MLDEIFGGHENSGRLVCELAGQNETMYLFGDNGRLVLLEPTGPGVVQKFLDRRGEGMHNIGLQVETIGGIVEHFASIGCGTFGWDGNTDTAAFSFPKETDGILYEFAQDDDADRDCEGMNARLHEQYLAFLAEQRKGEGA